MTGEDDRVPLSEASREVEVAMTRLALMHLSFSKTLIEELGEEKGKELVIKSIMEYGKLVGERVKRGLPDLPKYGVYGECVEGRVYDCILAKIFREYGEEDLGRLYCYIDSAKTMAADPYQKLIHKECAACGDDYCTFCSAPTTEKERQDFRRKEAGWREVDPRLAAQDPSERK